jgi:Putative Actinobacterial Holin-X, holin superfamily III
MLKPVEPTPGREERQVGELVQELVDDGKAYARAEFGLAKALAFAKAKAFAFAAALLVAALFIAMAALNAFAVGVVLALSTLIGPLAAAFAGFVIFAAIAGGLAWWGIEKARRSL